MELHHLMYTERGRGKILIFPIFSVQISTGERICPHFLPICQRNTSSVFPCGPKVVHYLKSVRSICPKTESAGDRVKEVDPLKEACVSIAEENLRAFGCPLQTGNHRACQRKYRRNGKRLTVCGCKMQFIHGTAAAFRKPAHKIPGEFHRGPRKAWINCILKF